MRIRVKKKIPSITVYPEDTLSLRYRQEAINNLTGEFIKVVKEQEVLKSRIGRKMTLDEAVIFDVEAGEFGDEVEDGIGGAFLSTKKEKK